MRYADNAIMDPDPQKREASFYLEALTTALAAHLEDKTKLNSDGVYKANDVNIGKFIDDFERAVNANHLDEKEKNPSLTRKPYEGKSFSEVAKNVWDRVSRYDKTLPEIWADSVAAKLTTHEKMNEITDEAERNLQGVTASSIGDKSKDLANIVMAKEAMDKVISNKTALEWINPRNWKRNLFEFLYSRSLDKKVEEYRANGLPVSTVVLIEHKQNMMGGVLTEHNNSIKLHAREKAKA